MIRTRVEKYVRGLIFQVILLGCGAAAGDKPTDDSDATTDTTKVANKAVKVKTTLKCKKGTRLDYDNFGRSFLLNYCTTCHSADHAQEAGLGSTSGMNFDSADAAQIWRIRMLKVVRPGTSSTGNSDSATNSGDDEATRANPKEDSQAPGQITMPPDDSLTDEDRTLFLEWLNCGAPAGNP